MASCAVKCGMLIAAPCCEKSRAGKAGRALPAGGCGALLIVKFWLRLMLLFVTLMLLMRFTTVTDFETYVLLL